MSHDPTNPFFDVGRRLTDAFLARDARAIVAELAADAVFHSPVADYEGRARIAAVLDAVTEVIAAPRATHVVEGSGKTLLAFTAELAAAPVTASCLRPASPMARSQTSP